MAVQDVATFAVPSSRARLANMDFLHTQLSAIQRQLSFVATDPLEWKLYVQVFSWAVTLFESYLVYVVFFIPHVHAT